MARLAAKTPFFIRSRDLEDWLSTSKPLILSDWSHDQSMNNDEKKEELWNYVDVDVGHNYAELT